MRRESLSSYLLHLFCCESERIYLDIWNMIPQTGGHAHWILLYIARCMSESLDHELYIPAGFWIKFIVVFFLISVHSCFLFCAIWIWQQEDRSMESFQTILARFESNLQHWTVWTRRRCHLAVSDRTECCVISTLCPWYLRAHRLHLWALQMLSWLCELREKCRSHTLYYMCVFL